MNQAKKPTLGSIFKVDFFFLDIILMNHVLKIIIL